MPQNFKLTNAQMTTLKIAVNTFNKAISKLQREQKDNTRLLYFLPDKIENFQELGKSISNMNEYQRVIKSLRSLKNASQQQIVKVGKEKILRWQENELTQDVYNVVRRLENEYKKLNEPFKNRQFSRLQMGSTEDKSIKALLKEITEFDKKSGREYKQFLRKMSKIGRNDYLNKKQIVYKENCINVLKRFKNLEGGKELIEYLNNLSPKDFYDKMKENDLTLDLSYVSDTTMTQNLFNEIYSDLVYEISYFNYQKEKYKNGLEDVKQYVLRGRNGKIIKISDSIAELQSIKINSTDENVKQGFILEWENLK